MTNQQLKKFYIKSGSLDVIIGATCSTDAVHKIFKNIKRYVKDPNFNLGMYVYVNNNGDMPCDNDEIILTEKILNETNTMRHFNKNN